MEFFAPLPPEPPRERPPAPVIPAWVQPPHDEVPVAVPMARRLARVPGAALTLRRLDVYREGVVIRTRLDLRLEDDLTPERRERLNELLNPCSHRFSREGSLRLGVALPDGTRAETGLDSHPHAGRPRSERPSTPQLVMFGGGGNGGADRWTAEARAWLWPLPPAGRLTLHFVAEALGIPEGSVELDAAGFAETSLGVIDAWGS